MNTAILLLAVSHALAAGPNRNPASAGPARAASGLPELKAAPVSAKDLVAVPNKSGEPLPLPVSGEAHALPRPLKPLTPSASLVAEPAGAAAPEGRGVEASAAEASRRFDGLVAMHATNLDYHPVPEGVEKVSALPSSTGMVWWKKNYLTHIVAVEPKRVEELRGEGFRRVENLTLTMDWDRVSTVFNGFRLLDGQRSRNRRIVRTFDATTMAEGLRLLVDFTEDPVKALDRHPSLRAYLLDSAINAAERGFVIDSALRAVTGSQRTLSEETLYRFFKRSGYHAL